MFIDTFSALCDKKKVSMNKACIEIGISRTATAKWKKGAVPNGQTLTKIAEYFDVPVGLLLGEETKEAPAGSGERSISDDDIKFALFGGDGDITDAMYDEVKNFAAFVKQREAGKKKE